jgi:hypothetical protein
VDLIVPVKILVPRPSAFLRHQLLMCPRRLCVAYEMFLEFGVRVGEAQCLLSSTKLKQQMIVCSVCLKLLD